jgi:hypothetical protein
VKIDSSTSNGIGVGILAKSSSTCLALRFYEVTHEKEDRPRDTPLKREIYSTDCHAEEGSWHLIDAPPPAEDVDT